MNERRRFLKTVAAGYAATALGYPANETIGIGCIGTGGRSQMLMRNIEAIKGARITAVCDVWDEIDRRSIECNPTLPSTMCSSAVC